VLVAGDEVEQVGHGHTLGPRADGFLLFG
jgi:hypothetical protein